MNYIKRNLENVVRQVTREYPVLLVTGSRQVGKTTMLQKLMEGTERGYVTLDDLNERNIAKTDPELFLQLHKPPACFYNRIWYRCRCPYIRYERHDPDHSGESRYSYGCCNGSPDYGRRCMEACK